MDQVNFSWAALAVLWVVGTGLPSLAHSATSPADTSNPAVKAEAASPAPAESTTAVPAAAPAPAEAGVHPFACPGEAASIMRGLSAAQIAEERDKWLQILKESNDPAPAMAHKYCVQAELMRRIGDPRAAGYYEKALTANPNEPGYELWYGYYLRNVRGPGYPLTEQAETHYFQSVQKMETRKSAGPVQDYDGVTQDWTRRGLVALYQDDGVPLLPWRAYPYTNGVGALPSLAFTSVNNVAQSPSDFNEVDDVRNFTSEAQFSSSPMRLNRALDRQQLQGIARDNVHFETYNRLRLRQPMMGALDLIYKRRNLYDAQITKFDTPDSLNDVKVTQMGAGWRRPFNLYPAFDLMLAGEISNVDRTGTVESFPGQTQSFVQYEFRPTISRFLGPDKLTVGGVWVRMDIPDTKGGLPEERGRGRTIVAATFDYAVYRPLLLPQLQIGSLELKRMETRGWHFYGGAAQDAEVFGTRLAIKRDFYAGTTLMGMGGYDFTFQPTLFTHRVEIGGEGLEDTSQTNAQYRTTISVLKRLIDEDVTPGMPAASFLGLRPASLNLVIPVRHDLAIEGLDKFENLRGGVELWGKAIATGLRGASFLATVGYEYEWFYRLDKSLNVFRADLRMGWAQL